MALKDKRIPIQITATAAGHPHIIQSLVALAADGTLWESTCSLGSDFRWSNWEQLPELPQPAEDH